MIESCQAQISQVTSIRDAKEAASVAEAIAAERWTNITAHGNVKP